MKKRIISAIVALIIVVPLLVIGGSPYKVGVIVIGLIGLIEIIKAKDSKKNIPLFVKIITIYNFLIVMLSNINNTNITLSIGFNYIIINILSLLLPIILYHDDDKYNINDAFYLIASNIFLGLSFSILMSIREYNMYYLLFVLLITFLSDTFAYLTGMLIGKHKFSESISPNKSIEGFFGGLIISVFVTTILYITAMDYTGNVLILIVLIILLSIVSTLGDLIFSSIKRHFGIKDFGKIMPGHGGVLDRLDSLLFVLITFSLLSGLI